MPPPTKLCEAPTKVSDFINLISSHYGELTPKLRQLADFVTTNQNDLPFETVATLAERSGIQASAVVRFAKLFGFEGFTDMQQLFRTQLMEIALRNSARPGPSATPATYSCHPMINDFAVIGQESLRTLQMEGPNDPFQRSVDLLVGAKRVHILGEGRGFAFAVYLATTLRQLGCGPVHLLDGIGGTLADQASTIEPDETLLIISLMPQTDGVLSFAQRLHQGGIRSIICVADEPVPSISSISSVTLQVSEGSLQGVQGLTGMICLLSALAVEIHATAQLQSG